MAIITISRVPGAGGDEIAAILSKRLSYRLFNRALLNQWFDNHDDCTDEVRKLDEHSPSLWERSEKKRFHYMDMLKEIMYETAIADDAIIIGRGGQCLLGGLPDVLNLRISCSYELGVKRLIADASSPVEDPKAYHHAVQEREGFYRYFFQRNCDNSSLYDLVINTDRITYEKAADLIEDILDKYFTENCCCETHRASSDFSLDGSCSMEDLLLAQQINNRILYTEKIPVEHLEVKAKDGLVSLKGTVTSESYINCCVEISRKAGASKVESLLYVYSPSIYNW